VVRKLRLAFACSAAVHAALVAWAATRPVTPRSVAAPPTTAIEIIPVAPAPVAAEPLEVAIVEEPPAPERAATAALPAARRVLAPAAPAASTAPRAATPPATPPLPGVALVVPGTGSGEAAPPAPSPRNPLMAMRRGEAARDALRPRGFDDLDHVPRGTDAEKPVAPSGQLSESGGGTHKAETSVFVADVKADGTVKFTDQPNASIHLALPRPRDVGRGVASWYTGEKGTFGEPLQPGDPALGKAFQASAGSPLDQPNDASGNQGDRAPQVSVPVVGGGFDVNDWLTRRHGEDPYASRKLAMLDATRDERVQIGNQHRAAQLRRAPEIMQRNLAALWAATRDPAARKEALFELWDECLEDGDPGAAAAGAAARRLVIGFIRGHLPAGSPDAFTPAELARLARRKQSKAAFDPYE